MFKKVSTKLMVLGATLGSMVAGSFARAAADSDLTTALASTSALATDNKSIILTFLVAVGTVVLVIAVAKGGLNWGIAKVAGSIGGRRKRR